MKVNVMKVNGGAFSFIVRKRDRYRESENVFFFIERKSDYERERERKRRGGGVGVGGGVVSRGHDLFIVPYRCDMTHS